LSDRKKAKESKNIENGGVWWPAMNKTPFSANDGECLFLLLLLGGGGALHAQLSFVLLLIFYIHLFL
jgi:hypothetical protein